jgi:hypothetical protein
MFRSRLFILVPKLFYCKEDNIPRIGMKNLHNIQFKFQSLACVLKHPFPKVQAIEHLNLEYALCSAHCQGDIRPRVVHVLKHTILSLRQSVDCKLKGISGHRSRTYSDCSLKKRGPTRTSWTRECWGNKRFLLTSVGVPVFELFVQRS